MLTKEINLAYPNSADLDKIKLNSIFKGNIVLVKCYYTIKDLLE